MIGREEIGKEIEVLAEGEKRGWRERVREKKILQVCSFAMASLEETFLFLSTNLLLSLPPWIEQLVLHLFQQIQILLLLLSSLQYHFPGPVVNGSL